MRFGWSMLSGFPRESASEHVLLLSYVRINVREGTLETQVSNLQSSFRALIYALSGAHQHSANRLRI